MTDKQFTVKTQDLGEVWVATEPLRMVVTDSTNGDCAFTTLNWEQLSDLIATLLKVRYEVRWALAASMGEKGKGGK